MDILTFVKEVNFEIKDNLGFDVLWDSMTGKQCLNVEALLLKWLGYDGELRRQKEVFIKLLESNEIEYREDKFPLLRSILGQMRPEISLKLKE